MAEMPLSLGPDGAAGFLAEYWQKRPLLIRNALPGFTGPLAPDDIAELAADDAVESRLICRARDGDGQSDWTLEDGPVPHARFNRLGERDWTVLIQSVEYWVPAVAELLDAFTFLPNWRLEDIMVSYAVPGGGVGPHVDQYDVFLLQGAGRRRWRVGPADGDNGPERPHPRMRLLADMPVANDYVLDPGDMLYLPPGVAHDGEALDPCFTYSIGLRAPSVAALATAVAQAAAERLANKDRLFRDPVPPIQGNPGEISRSTLAEVRRLVLSALDDEDLIADAFAREVTEPRMAELPEGFETEAGDDAVAALMREGRLMRPGGARLAYVETGDGVSLYANGDRLTCPGPLADLARALCARPNLPAGALAPWADDAEARKLVSNLMAIDLLVAE